ncbi:carbohydrate ABC transporter permease [Actinopolymorpha pittospori]|uniref:ABC-type glycerol-3-phosphate transport system permease component n=1 Tax=Actinopolymorpha pittospori TaxID=648752 RepID=A0A927N1U4_9ACTN|nr:carbohydrate ABC transporter permease [Actinopolymorpha pittospori]MBE1609398.1 ABC-type glycerol-3-phosphate transport system permease component [Actinopolymorpha pittospori]
MRAVAVVRRAALYVVMVALALVFLIPMIWLVSTSLKSQGQVFAYPPVWIPDPLQWGNYVEAMSRAPLLVWLANTVMIAVLALAGTLMSSSLVAFGFARLRFPGRRVLFILLLSTMMLPDVVTLVPQFVLFRSIGWVDTFLPLIVPSFLGGGAFNIFLVRQFYLTIPRDFDEAARLDGASNLRIWWHIILPLSRPVLVAVGIFSFVYHWNDFLLPLIYLQSEGNKTLALGLRAFISPTDASWNISMAASMFLVIPVLIVFFVAQRQFIRGVVMTGIQGR